MPFFLTVHFKFKPMIAIKKKQQYSILCFREMHSYNLKYEFVSHACHPQPITQSKKMQG